MSSPSDKAPDAVRAGAGRGFAAFAARDGFELRPAQLRMLEAVQAVLREGGVLACEAATGTGKTLAYLAPALACPRRVVVSTRTKTLQEQIATKDAPLLLSGADTDRDVALPAPVVVLKGRSSYLCRLRLAGLREALGLFDDDAEVTALEAFCRTTATGDRAEIPAAPEPWPVWQDVCSTAETCARGACPHIASCFVTAARRRAAAASVVVVNHHLYFADLAVRGNDDVGVLPDHHAVIFDEAHQVEEVACEFFGASLAGYAVRAFVRDATRRLLPLGDGERGLQQAVKGLFPAAQEVFDALLPADVAVRRFTPADLTPDVEESMDWLSDLLTRVELGFARLAEGDPAFLPHSQRAAALNDSLKRIRTFDPAVDVGFVERRGASPVLCVRPTDAAPILRERLFPRVPAVVFTSATLSTGGDFRFFLDRLGLPRDTPTLTLPPVFDYERQALLYVPRLVPAPDAPGFRDAVAAEVERLLVLLRGRALVLFTSHQALNACHARLAGRIPYRVLRQGERSRDAILATFREDIHSVLLATASFWEGVDVAGEALSLVVMDKLPFAPPDDPVVLARSERLLAAGRNPFFHYQVPQAIIAVRQGFGRLIRRQTDRGVVAILDPRIHTRAYGRAFLTSLPDCHKTDDFEDVVSFVRNSM